MSLSPTLNPEVGDIHFNLEFPGNACKLLFFQASVLGMCSL